MAMLDQTYEPQLAKLSCPRQEMVNNQVHGHAHMNFVVWGTAGEQVLPPLQMYTQAIAIQQLQSRQKNYLSMYAVLSGVRQTHAKADLA